jgi:hypothetical protein
VRERKKERKKEKKERKKERKTYLVAQLIKKYTAFCGN